MIRVLLDATAVPPDRRGVGRYVDSLIPALTGLGAQVRVACQPRDVTRYGELSGAAPLAGPRLTERPATRLVWEQAGLPGLIRRADPDVVHSPHYTHAVATRWPLAVTLHDATFFTDPRLHTAVKAPFFRAATATALRRAGCCIVPSQATADELVRVARAEPDRLHVAHLGVDRATFHPPAPEQLLAFRARHGLSGEWIAFLGTIEPRKNVPALIEGWAAACAGRPDPPTLVLAGGAGWDDTVDAAAAVVPAGLRLLRPGYLPIDELAALLGGAAVVGYPSLGEGFGLPVAEAMACGAAVLTTPRLALGEVGGDAVAYCEPDAASIGSALRALLDDAPRRAELGAAGLRRSAQFTWESCAKAHLLAYEQALRVGRRPWRRP